MSVLNERPEQGRSGISSSYGLQQIGFAALESAGLRSGGAPPSAAEVAVLLQWYLGNLTALAAAAGLPQDKVHVVPHQPPNTPLTGGVVAHSQLGISVYRFPPDLVGSLDTTLAAAGRTTWATVEWGLGDF